MSTSTGAMPALRTAGRSDVGLLRDVNEDRCHVDPSRGVFIVVDGIGGQAAGGKAADVALSMLRTRLERETGPVAARIREAIAIANNEIHRVAGLRPEWSGMACVLTVVVLDDGHATVGHVGDTRLYKLRSSQIEKITRDHSPVGEREDAREISELEAMRHPRRNEVYRDVGSEPHQPDDPEFIDLFEVPFEPDAALLLCSDGLSDLLDSGAIREVVEGHAGQPKRVVKALIDAANAAGGKDNVSVVYVEGERFATSPSEITRQRPQSDPAPPNPLRMPDRPTPADVGDPSVGAARRRNIRMLLVVLLLVVLALAALTEWAPRWTPLSPPVDAPASRAQRIVVPAGGSISAALDQAIAGSEVIVEPGEYHERVALPAGVRLVSRVPRGATVRLSGAASEADPAVVADGIAGAELVGFRIIGDAATPLGIGVLVKNAAVSLVDLEIAGASNAAIDMSGRSSRGSVMASDVHDNPGTALAVRSEASPRIAHNVFLQNGASQRVQRTFIIDEDAAPAFEGNVFQGISRQAFPGGPEGSRTTLSRDNWFLEPRDPPPATSAGRRDRRGR